MLPLVVALLAHEIHVLARGLVGLVFVVMRVLLRGLAYFGSIVGVLALRGLG